MSPSTRILRGCTAAVSSASVVAFLTISAATTPQVEAPAGPRPAFEAATINLAAPDAVRNRVTPASPNRLTFRA